MTNSPFKATEKILLYYPTINIPSPSWIRQGLMYWDQIGSIVPNSYDADLPRHLRYSEEIQPIYNANLFRPFNPQDLFAGGLQQNIPDVFKVELFEVLDRQEFVERLPTERKFTEALYPEEVIETLYQELLDRNLVSPERKDDFIYFEENTSLIYMTILAKHLANINDQLVIPSTDLRDYERLNFEANPSIDKSNPCLRVEFRDLLRVPADDVEIKEVMDFRLKHNDKLLDFRQQVLNKFEDDIKKCGDRNEIKDKTIRFRNQIEKGIKDLDSLFKEEKLQTGTGTLKAIFKAPHITTAIISVTVGMEPIVSIVALAGALAVEISDFYVSRKNAKLDKLRTNAYSYLYQADKELGAKQKSDN